MADFEEIFCTIGGQAKGNNHCEGNLGGSGLSDNRAEFAIEYFDILGECVDGEIANNNRYGNT